MRGYLQKNTKNKITTCTGKINVHTYNYDAYKKDKNQTRRVNCNSFL